MTEHVAPGRPPVPCWREKFGTCRMCDLLDRGGPHYREDYRRIFFPDEFPPPPEPNRPIPPDPTDETPTGQPAPAPSIPLAGDIVEQAAKLLGADRLARWIEARTGQPCGCPERQAKLNALDARLRRWLGQKGG